MVTGNGPLTYTFTIRNTGNTALTGQEGAVITDTFDPILNITGVTFNGTAWTSPEDYTYDAATGAFATVAGKLDGAGGRVHPKRRRLLDRHPGTERPDGNGHRVTARGIRR